MCPQLEYIVADDFVVSPLNHVPALQLSVIGSDGIRLGYLLYLVSVGKHKRAYQVVFVRVLKFDREYALRLDKRIPLQLREDHRIDVKPSACGFGIHQEVELFFDLRGVIGIVLLL